MGGVSLPRASSAGGRRRQVGDRAPPAAATHHEPHGHSAPRPEGRSEGREVIGVEDVRLRAADGLLGPQEPRELASGANRQRSPPERRRGKGLGPPVIVGVIAARGRIPGVVRDISEAEVDENRLRDVSSPAELRIYNSLDEDLDADGVAHGRVAVRRRRSGYRAHVRCPRRHGQAGRVEDSEASTAHVPRRHLRDSGTFPIVSSGAGGAYDSSAFVRERYRRGNSTSPSNLSECQTEAALPCWTRCGEALSHQ